MSETKRAHKIAIEAAAAGRGSKILVEGKEMRGVQRAELWVDCDKGTRLKLQLVCLDGAAIEGESIIEVTTEELSRAVEALRAWEHWYTAESALKPPFAPRELGLKVLKAFPAR